jgi:GntR family transcriptional repressor for pyruvate dehydrogenase complex
MADQRRATRVSLSDGLTDAILELISEQRLAPGDRLPAVQALARHFQVAIPSVREALQRLQAAGILTIRHGSGVYVSSDAPRRILANPHTLRTGERVVRELLETRLLLEPAAARLAADRAGNADPSAAASLLAVASRQLDDEPSLTITNMEFHVALAHMSGNPILAETIEALLHTYLKEQRDIVVPYDETERDYEEHRRILAAITAGDALSASGEMLGHLSSVVEIVTGQCAAGAPAASASGRRSPQRRSPQRRASSGGAARPEPAGERG